MDGLGVRKLEEEEEVGGTERSCRRRQMGTWRQEHPMPKLLLQVGGPGHLLVRLEP